MGAVEVEAMTLPRIHPELASTTHAMEFLMKNRTTRTSPLNNVTLLNRQHSFEECSKKRIQLHPYAALMDGNFTRRLSRV